MSSSPASGIAEPGKRASPTLSRRAYLRVLVQRSCWTIKPSTALIRTLLQHLARSFILWHLRNSHNIAIRSSSQTIRRCNNTFSLFKRGRHVLEGLLQLLATARQRHIYLANSRTNMQKLGHIYRRLSCRCWSQEQRD